MPIWMLFAVAIASFAFGLAAFVWADFDALAGTERPQFDC